MTVHGPTPPPSGYVLRVVCVADGSDTPLAGRYVRRWHPSRRSPGLPLVDAVDAPTQARVFPDVRSALDYWQQVNRRYPKRPDGKPNRPMTAFTCEVEPLRG